MGRRDKKVAAVKMAMHLANGEVARDQSLKEMRYAELRMMASCYESDDPILRYEGIQAMQKIAERLAWADAIEFVLKKESVGNKANAGKPRDYRRETREEIRTQFRHLVRNGHTTREARGILLARGLASQPTINRATADLVKSIH